MTKIKFLIISKIEYKKKFNIENKPENKNLNIEISKYLKKNSKNIPKKNFIFTTTKDMPKSQLFCFYK